MDIYKKLLNIQSKLKAPKSQRNNFGNYNYRNCEDILEAVKPLCVESGVVLYLSDRIVQTGERYYVEATATLVDVETNDDVQVISYAREEESKKGMDGSQVTGAASSYARKYALNGLFDIDDTKDSDTTNTGTEDKHVDKENPAKKVAAKNQSAPAINANEASQVEIICSDCHLPITSYKGKTPSEIAEGSNKTFGRPLCAICSMRAAKKDES